MSALAARRGAPGGGGAAAGVAGGAARAAGRRARCRCAPPPLAWGAPPRPLAPRPRARPARAFTLERPGGGPPLAFESPRVTVGSAADADVRVDGPGGEGGGRRWATLRWRRRRRRRQRPRRRPCSGPGAARHTLVAHTSSPPPSHAPAPAPASARPRAHAVAPRHAELTQKGKQVFLTALVGEEVFDSTATFIDGDEARPRVSYVLSAGSALAFGAPGAAPYVVRFEEPSGANPLVEMLLRGAAAGASPEVKRALEGDGKP
jgi:hypothetical protein